MYDESDETYADEEYEDAESYDEDVEDDDDEEIEAAEDDDDEDIEALDALEDDLDDESDDDEDDDDESDDDESDDDESDDEDLDVEDDEDDDDESEGLEAAAEYRRRRRRRRGRRARLAAQKRRRLAHARARVRRRRAMAQAIKRARLRSRRVARQLRRIPKLARPRRVKPVHGSQRATITLPSGRKATVAFKPHFVSAKSVNSLRRQFLLKDKKQAAAIRKLAATLKKVNAQQVKVSKDFAGQVARSQVRIEKALTKKFALQRTSVTAERRRLAREQRLQNRRLICNSAVLAGAVPAFVTMWDRNEPLAGTNLALLGTLAGTLFADDVLRLFAGKGKKGAGVRKAAQVVSDVSCLGGVAFVVAACLQKQTSAESELVTGTTQMTSATKEVDLGTLGVIPEGKRAPAVATIIDGRGAEVAKVAASVAADSDGKWTLTLTYLGAGSVDVAANGTTGTIQTVPPTTQESVNVAYIVGTVPR